MNKLSKLFFATSALRAVLAFSGSASAFQAAARKDAATEAPAPATTAAPSAKDIADVTAKGDVWLNLNTKVYHKAGDKEYGTTKKGKFMNEADAQKAGGHLSKEGAAKKAPAKAAKWTGNERAGADSLV